MRLAAALLLAGCASTPSIPDQPASITGTITHIARTTGGTRVLIEERPGQTSGDNKSSVTLTPQTQILLADPGSATPIRADQLGVGDRASAWFMGPVAESYPTQTTARVLVVYR